MKRILFNILLVLALVLTMGLVAAGPMAVAAVDGPPVTAGLVLHLDASDAGSITKNASTNKTSQWADLSGEGNDAAQATAGKQPLWMNAVLEGNPVIRFDGTNDWLLTPDDVLDPASQDWMIFLVAQTSSTADQNFLQQLDGNGTGRMWIDYYSTSSNFSSNLGGARRDSGFAPSVDTPYIVGLAWNNSTTTLQWYINGDAKNSYTFAMEESHGAIRLGANKADSGKYLDGDIAEILIYAGALSNYERKQVEVYLDEKWLGGPPLEVWVSKATGSDVFGDGTEGNPYATITKGINEVADTGTVHVKAGTYDVANQLNIGSKSLTIIGYNTVVARRVTGASYFLSANGGDYLKIQNIEINATVDSTTTNFVAHLSHVAEVVLEDFTVIGQGKDHTTDGGAYNPGTKNVVGGLDLNTVDTATLTNVSVSENGRNGLSFTDVDAVSLEDIAVADCGHSDSTGWAGLAIYRTDSGNTTVTESGTNTIDNVPIGVNVDDYGTGNITLPENGTSIVISGADIPVYAPDNDNSDAFAENVASTPFKVPMEVVPYVGFAAYFADEGSAIDAAVAFNTLGEEHVLIDLTNEVFIVGNNVTDEMSIQAAIDAASSDDTIEVRDGTYVEDLVIPAGKDGLGLVGAGAGTTSTIKGVQNVPIGDWPLAAPNIEILADDVIITGFNIESPDYAADNYTSGMVIGGGNAEIYENVFNVTQAETLGEISQAIQTYHEDAMTGVNVSGLNIHDNQFMPLASGSAAGYEGICINYSVATTADVTIADNVFGGEIVRAITTERSDTVISGNTIVTDLDPGLPGGDQGILVGASGLEAQDSVSVIGNTVEGFQVGIEIGTSGQTLTNINVTENTVHDNDTGILVNDSAEGVVVNYNNIVGNPAGPTGLHNDDTATLDGRYNWWGDASGPYHDPLNTDTLGDEVSDYVEFYPWLDDEWDVGEPNYIVDHFECYNVTEGPYVGQLVSLLDQFHDEPFDAVVEWPVFFGNPAEKEHCATLTPIWNWDDHFTVYTLTHAEEPQTWCVEVDNQFGEQNFKVSDPVMLAVPTRKEGHDEFVGPDHYLLYEVVDGEAPGCSVSLEDQFTSEPSVTVLEPVYFGNPVEKNGEPIGLAPETHMVFYRIEGGPYSDEVWIKNQFGVVIIDVVDGSLLAVPSEKVDFTAFGADRIGIYRPSTRQFVVDMDGDGVWNATVDKQIIFGLVGDKPITGHWNGDGADEIGIYRPSTRQFVLDMDGDGVWNATLDWKTIFGLAGDKPITGDWNGDGTDQIGIYRPSTRQFVLDLDGDGVWNATLDWKTIFGSLGDTPITGDWNGDGCDQIGIYRPSNRLFVLDMDGDGAWSGATDWQTIFGLGGDEPITGRW
jgi:hypothetical protein